MWWAEGSHFIEQSIVEIIIPLEVIISFWEEKAIWMETNEETIWRSIHSGPENADRFISYQGKPQG